MARLAQSDRGANFLNLGPLPPEEWQRLAIVSRVIGCFALFLLGFCVAHVDGLGDTAGISRTIAPALTALLGLSFEARHPRPEHL